MHFGNNRIKVSMFMGTFLFVFAEKKPTKRGIKKGPFFLCGSSYDRDKQNEREYFVQKEEPADADH